MDTAVMVRAVDSNIAERKCMVTSLIMFPSIIFVSHYFKKLFYHEKMIKYLYLNQV